MRLDHILFKLRQRSDDRNYRLQGIQLFRSLRETLGWAFRKIVWDDRRRDEAWLLAALHAAGPQATEIQPRHG